MSDIAVQSATAPTVSRQRLALLALGFRAHAPLLLLALFIVGLETLAELYFQLPQQTGFAMTIVLCMVGGLPAIVVSVAVERLIYLARFVKPKHPLPALAREMWAFLSDPKRLANGIPAYLALVLLIYAFGRFKPGIPAIQPFVWDVAFYEIDRMLHFGVDPWRLLQPIFGNTIMTIAIDGVYCLWFAVMYFGFTQYAFTKRYTVERMRFFIAFFLVWSVGGMVLAVVFSSAGPVYFTLAGNTFDPYAALMSQLHEVGKVWPLFALNAQKLLAQSYLGQGELAIAGISAMPSLHNATAALLAFAGFQVSRKLGWAGVAFAVAILLGSVHLGWHYAVDGYAGVAIAAVIWWVALPIAKLLARFQPSREFEAALNYENTQQ